MIHVGIHKHHAPTIHSGMSRLNVQHAVNTLPKPVHSQSTKPMFKPTRSLFTAPLPSSKGTSKKASTKNSSMPVLDQALWSRGMINVVDTLNNFSSKKSEELNAVDELTAGAAKASGKAKNSGIIFGTSVGDTPTHSYAKIPKNIAVTLYTR